MLSIFDIYKIGIGPSSSHTNGPMIAGYNFTHLIAPMINKVNRIQVDLYGSLSLTGKGHHTDKAVILGLLGNKPETIKINIANNKMKTVIKNSKLFLLGNRVIDFKYKSDIIFHSGNLPLHENGMTITAYDLFGSIILFETYYSNGGGFITTAKEFKKKKNNKDLISVEFPFKSASEMLFQAKKHGLSLGNMILRNELSFRTMRSIDRKVKNLWKVMLLCMKRGFETEGILEGGLNVTRRAPRLLKKLKSDESFDNDPMVIMDWINLFAFAVSEENASGGQIVTSPTNGSAGIIPAVLMYYNKFIKKLDTNQLKDFFAVSGAIGILYKTNASISGAEVGCQGEVGVSSSMAAASLTALRGGTNNQICIAAEIAMEHSLGMTCDPISGLVQVPCIERNAMGAIKAINASRIALKSSNTCLISLDKVINTMYQTGKDINKRYRETSLGGLASIYLEPPHE
ncbi:L-serine dehydratase 1 [Candidatus Photodesmus katoptron]|uniref:L-serine dehydratase n=1 Tax=Candidatus Photodesmus katoptron Akat1 TaxID=1236703 RepID=S3DKG0_9GAMM|nr:L-serine ammonia-lyase [Candidatus Photodesmus katoptron]EPE37619.1 L-serine dehydratase 1 [Candidatus Photodesmus katoptron Akat1]KEY90662.1 L-serine dehydratase 1 [Candidatus Photodesmus katoptron]